MGLSKLKETLEGIKNAVKLVMGQITEEVKNFSLMDLMKYMDQLKLLIGGFSFLDDLMGGNSNADKDEL